MESFGAVESVVAPLLLANIDTDAIIPKQYLKTLKRTGLGQHLFAEMRYDADGEVVTSFVLNKPEYSDSKVLLAGANFGCGSSREHAPWALLDFGIRCVVSTSFADIFYNNCFKNGILPVVLSPDNHKVFCDAVCSNSTAPVTCKVDLVNRVLSVPTVGLELFFLIDDEKRQILLEGLDDISSTLKLSDRIDLFEKADAASRPWLYL